MLSIFLYQTSSNTSYFITYVLVLPLLQNGLLVTVLGMFQAVIDIISLSRPMSTSELKDVYEKGTVLLARVTFADHGSKTIRLSLRPHVVEFRAPRDLVQLGEVIKGLCVTLAQRKVGILLSSKASDDSEVASNGKLDSDVDDDGALNMSKKAQDARRKKVRNVDEQIRAAFIHKSSLVDLDNEGRFIRPEDIERHYKVNYMLSLDQTTIGLT